MKRIRNRKLFYTFLIAYLVVFTLPLLCGIGAYVTMGRKLSEETMRSNMLLLQESGLKVQQELDGILALGSELSEQVHVKHYISRTMPLSSNDRYEAAEIIKSLNNAAQRIAMVDDITLFVGRTHNALTTTAMYTADLYEYCGNRIDNDKVDGWLNGLSDTRRRYFDIEATMLGPNGDIPGVVISQTLPKDSLYAQPQAVLVAIIRQSSLIQQLTVSDYVGEVAVLNSAGDILASTNTELKPEDLAFTDVNGSVQKRLLDQDMHLLYVTLASYGCKIVYLIPQESFMSGLNAINNLSLVVFGLCIAIGLVLVVMLSKRQYSPIADILNNINNIDIGMPAMNMKNDYERIHGSITAIHNRNMQLEQSMAVIKRNSSQVSSMLTRSQAQIQRSLLQSILNGSVYDVCETASWLSFYGIEFKYPFFAVLALQLDDIGEYAFGENPILTIHTLVETMLNGLYAEQFTGYLSVINENELAVIINMPNQDRQRTLHQMARLIQQRVPYPLLYAIGGPCGGLNELANAYCDAKGQIARHQNGQNAEAANSAEKTSDDAMAFLEYQMRSKLRTGEMSDLILPLRRILSSSSLAEKECKLKMLRLLLFIKELFSTQQLALLDDKVSMIEEYLVRSEVSRAEAISALLSILTSNSRRTQSSDAQKPLAEQIQRYIEEHLFDPMLSQAIISTEFNMSQSNLSKFFKKNWGLNMSDYINQARVVRTIPYLQSTNMTLADIAEKVGFGNSKTLIRVFKKYEGTTPGRYRQ